LQIDGRSPLCSEYFDVVWAEGSIFVIGFEKKLSCWKKFLKTGGSLALTRMVWFTENPPDEIATFMREAYPPSPLSPDADR